MPEKQGKKWEKAKRWWAKIWHEYREACLLLLFAIAGVALSAGALGLLKDVIVGDMNITSYRDFPWVLGLPFLTAPVLLRIWLVRFKHKETDLATARDNASIAQKSERNQRYTTIITQLSKTLPFRTGDSGHTEERPHWDVRIGGLYALEKLMQEAPAEYHDIGINVLCAYVRNSQQFREESHTSEQPAQENETGYRSVPDVQVALTILGRKKKRDDAPIIDLEGVNLRGVYLRGLMLEGANLAFANLRGANLASAYLSGANLTSANLSGANLTSTCLENADIVNANLTNANLTNAHLKSVDLRDANLTSANLKGVTLRGPFLSPINPLGTDLSGANLTSAYLGNVNLSGINLRDADLYHTTLAFANLRGADLRRANLAGANLIDAYLRDADLTDAKLEGVYLEDANLEGAKIDKQWEGSEMLKGTKGKPIFIDTRSPDERHPLIAPDPDAT